MRPRAADLISLSRLFLIAPWIVLFSRHSAYSLLALGLMVASDFFDGFIARRGRGPSGTAASGAALDAYCDFAVVASIFFTLGVRDARYLLACAMAAFAFVSWRASRAKSRGAIYGRLGKYAGAVCYALAFHGNAKAIFQRDGLEVWSLVDRFAICAISLYLVGVCVENLLPGSESGNGKLRIVDVGAGHKGGDRDTPVGDVEM